MGGLNPIKKYNFWTTFETSTEFFQTQLPLSLISSLDINNLLVNSFHVN